MLSFSLLVSNFLFSLKDAKLLTRHNLQANYDVNKSLNVHSISKALEAAFEGCDENMSLIALYDSVRDSVGTWPVMSTVTKSKLSP